ncbi:glycerophosphodiester phosphodiesterase [Halarchaeum sp. P4]|uniref:glycerophosphodiester phosphodiesterase n=1 Tax=Halarchaeum sp. P4 TaxID=3421639 RepID=UPI003EBACBDE
MAPITSPHRRTVLKGTAVTALTSLVGGTASAASDDTDAADRPEETDESPILAAHRGFKGVYPENTVAAFENAVAGGANANAAVRGCDMVECDIVPAGGQPWKGEDFELAVFHDDKLADRDGGQRGPTDAPNKYVWEADADVVFDAEVLGSGETVPRLEEVVDAVPANVPLNVEWKAAGRPEMPDDFEARKETWRPFTERALDVLAASNNEFVVQSFSKAALATVREADPSVPIAYLLWDSIEDGLETARELDCEYVQPPYNMIKGTPFFRDEYYLDGSDWADIDLVEVAHSEGRKVIPYTVDNWYQAEQLVEAGVDGVISDYPGVLGREH